MFESKIPLSVPYIGGNAERYLKECLRTNYVSSVGPFVDRFESEFAAYVGSPYSIACVNGTAAIHIALIVAGVGPGDEVFVSDFTFIATVNPISYIGATPILVDADISTWNMDSSLVAEELDRRDKKGIKMPKAVLVAHVLGLPSDLESILETCNKYNIVVIEDSAEALGTSFTSGPLSGRQVGTIGLLGCFSFNGNKIMTTGGGGMIVTRDDRLALHAKHLTTQARLPGLEYFHDEIGFNYRLTNLAAALGTSQLEQLPDFLDKKRSIAKRYDDAFGDIPGVTLPPRPSWALPSMWLYTILLDSQVMNTDRKQVLTRTNENGIQTRPVWPPVHFMNSYSSAPRLFNGTGEKLYRQGLSIPSSVSLTKSDQSRVIDELLNNFDYID